MISISGSTGSTGSTSRTTDLTFAQQQAFRKLPHGLVEQVKRGVVTAQWALALPDRRQMSLAHPNICELLADDIIKPADIAKNFDDNHLSALERSAMIRSNLNDSIISTDQFSALNMDQLATLIDPTFQMKLSHFENRKELKEGNLTVLDLLQGFRSGSSGLSSSSSSSSSSISSSSSSFRTSSTSSTAGLTEAQQKAYRKLPYVLVEQIDKRVVTAQWALSLPEHLLIKLSKQNLCELLGDRIIEPVDITDHFNAVHLAFLEYSPTVRNLLKDKIITPKQFANLKRVEIEQLVDHRFVKLLRSVTSQQVEELLLMLQSDTFSRGSLSGSSSEDDCST